MQSLFNYTSAVREESSSGGTISLSPSFMACSSSLTQPTMVNIAYNLGIHNKHTWMTLHYENNMDWF